MGPHGPVDPAALDLHGALTSPPDTQAIVSDGPRVLEVCMKLRLAVLFLVLLLPSSLRADPVTLVDTGPGPSTYPGFSLSGLQWVAVEFDVPMAATITAIDAWMIVGNPGDLFLALYRDGGEVPAPGRLFEASGRIDGGDAGWRGLSSLNWTVDPGTYWIGFEQHGGFSAALPFPSERPLTNGAVVDRESSDEDYLEADGAAPFGVRVFAEATPDPVPEPASVILLSTGVAGLLARRRWKAGRQDDGEQTAP